MLNEDRMYDGQGHPAINVQNSHDLDTTQHFLADHAAELIVAFDYNATDPEVFIYVVTPDGVLSAGDYYLFGRCFTKRRSVSALNWTTCDTKAKAVGVGTTTEEACENG